MILAAYNVENLFSRPRAMNMSGPGSFAEGREILSEYSRLNTLLQNPIYTAADKADILDSLDVLGILDEDESHFVILRQNRARLIQRPQNGPVQVIANGRNDWIGWLDLKKEATNDIAVRMTAQVITDVNADVLAVVEAEDRIALKRFNDQLLTQPGALYEDIMLVDGNDERGIDVGLMTKNGYRIGSVLSHISDRSGGRATFDRDCPEFTVVTPANEKILVLVNHFKSKGYGVPAESNARRRAQARRVRAIYEERRAEGVLLIAIVGDLNDTPDSSPLRPLLDNGSNLQDVFQHPQFNDGGRPGTYGNCSASNKIDYILLSPELFNRVTVGGVHRLGIWGGANGTLFPHYPGITRSVHAASDHAAIWVDIQ
jgi:endonuclease/exonuclease/phosphatase family metal-dependent hydrolase